ncbi:unnamed protein product [Symbiodinium sp. CCMP2592]|nr:unnamed protein product [Symbiodinium sp. CCMP2592]
MAVADGRLVNFCFGESLSHLKAPSKPEEVLAEDRPPPTLQSRLDSSAAARNAGVENDACEEGGAIFNSFYSLTCPEDLEPLSRPLEPRRFLHEKHLDALEKIRKDSNRAFSTQAAVCYQLAAFHGVCWTGGSGRMF